MSLWFDSAGVRFYGPEPSAVLHIQIRGFCTKGRAGLWRHIHTIIISSAFDQVGYFYLPLTTLNTFFTSRTPKTVISVELLLGFLASSTGQPINEEMGDTVLESSLLDDPFP